MKVVIDLSFEEIKKLKEAIGDFDETEKLEVEEAVHLLIENCM